MSGPDGPRAALLEAMDLLRAGRLDEAEPILRRVLAAQPDQPDALHLLGLWHHERGDTNEAQRLIIEAIRVWPAEDPQRCVAWNNLGNVLVEDGRLEAAVATYRSALAAQPSASGTWTNLAGLLRRLGRGGEAEDAARRAVEAGPGDAQAWFTLSRVLVERGALPEGLEAHARGVALAPRDVVGREQVLQSLALLGVATKRRRCGASGDANDPTIPWPSTTRRPVSGRRRRGRQPLTSERCSTVSRRPSTPSWPSCTIGRRR